MDSIDTRMPPISDDGLHGPFEDVAEVLMAGEYNCAVGMPRGYRIVALRYLDAQRPDIAAVYAQLAVSSELDELPLRIQDELMGKTTDGEYVLNIWVSGGQLDQ